jgi:DNA polymerase V
VGVIGNHGACIIAKSYEAKAAGITTGMPIWDALKICPQAVYVKRDFQWYETLSRKMLWAGWSGLRGRFSGPEQLRNFKNA